MCECSFIQHTDHSPNSRVSDYNVVLGRFGVFEYLEGDDLELPRQGKVCVVQSMLNA